MPYDNSKKKKPSGQRHMKKGAGSVPHSGTMGQGGGGGSARGTMGTGGGMPSPDGTMGKNQRTGKGY